MIRILLLMLLLATGIALGPVLYGNKGYVLIAMGNYTVETSVVALVICILVLMALLWLSEWLIASAVRKTRQTHRRWKLRRAERARRQTLEGLEALLAGRWKQALPLLTKSAALSDRPHLNYLAAAEAAGKLQQSEQQQSLLAKAEKLPGTDTNWLALLKIRMLLVQGKQELALANARRLWQQGRRDAELLQLLKRLCLELSDWELLHELADELEQQRLLSATDALALRERAIQGSLDLAAKQSQTTLSQRWRNLPRKQQKQPQLLAHYSQLKAQAGEAQEAQSNLLKAAKRDLHPSLMKALLTLPASQTDELLYTVKHWLKGNSENPELLSLIGQLSIKAKRFDDARLYLEKAIKIRPDQDDFQALSSLLEQQGDHRAALQAMRQASRLTSTESAV